MAHLVVIKKEGKEDWIQEREEDPKQETISACVSIAIYCDFTQ